MKKVLLACSAGMSTSLLEEALKNYSKSIGVEIDVIAKASNEAKSILKNYDIVLLGPQVRYMEQSFKQIAGNIPVVIIPPQIYATAKGKECFELIEKFIK